MECLMEKFLQAINSYNKYIHNSQRSSLLHMCVQYFYFINFSCNTNDNAILSSNFMYWTDTRSWLQKNSKFFFYSSPIISSILFI